MCLLFIELLLQFLKHVVYLLTGNTAFTIISLKQEKTDLRKIKKGRQYIFQLSFYHPYILVGDPIYEIYKIDGMEIGFKGDLRTGQIVTTPNLQGLYYIPNKR